MLTGLTLTRLNAADFIAMPRLGAPTHGRVHGKLIVRPGRKVLIPA